MFRDTPLYYEKLCFIEKWFCECSDSCEIANIEYFEDDIEYIECGLCERRYFYNGVKWYSSGSVGVKSIRRLH